MNNLSEKETLIIKTMIENKINEIEKAKSQTKIVNEYVNLDNQAIELRKILNKINK